METDYLSLEDLCHRHPRALKAFRPQCGPYPFIFAATHDRVVLGNIEHHLVLALSAWPPFPVDPTSLLLQAVHTDRSRDVVGHVRPRIKAAGVVDQHGIVRSFDCPSLNVPFDMFDEDPQASLYRSQLRAAIFDFIDARRHTKRYA